MTEGLYKSQYPTDGEMKSAAAEEEEEEEGKWRDH